MNEIVKIIKFNLIGSWFFIHLKVMWCMILQIKSENQADFSHGIRGADAWSRKAQDPKNGGRAPRLFWWGAALALEN